MGLGDRSATRGGSAGSLFATLAVVGAEKTPSTVVGPQVASIPERLVREVERSWRADTTDITLIRLSARLGRSAAQDRAVALAADESAAVAQRIEAVQLLGEVGSPAAIEPLMDLAFGGSAQSLRLAAVEALSRFDDDRIAGALLETFPALPPPLRAKTCDVLLGRGAWARRMLAAVVTSA